MFHVDKIYAHLTDTFISKNYLNTIKCIKVILKIFLD